MHHLRTLACCLALAGCGTGSNEPPATAAPGSAHAGAGGGGSGGSGGDAAGGGGGSGGSAGGVVAQSLGIVVIDVQEAFVASSSNQDMAGVIERTRSAFQLAEDQGLPFFITFEASQTGDHALHAPLQPYLPAQAKSFTKTTFAATGLSPFADTLKQSGLSHLVVLGAETDVCVMQTVLGLRAMGFSVLLEHDATFTEETNTSPALRRMQQAGTLLVSQADVAGYVAKPGTLPESGSEAVKLARPANLGVVFNNFTDSALAGLGDPLTSQKSARLRELLLVSEWFDLPVYASDVAAGLPGSFAQYFQGQLRPLGQLAQDGSVQQLVFAGSDVGLGKLVSTYLGSHELFVMEDALLAQASAQAQADLLKPLVDGGLVPTTYKSFYYEMTRSVNLTEWPSQSWVKKYDEYFSITQAPEDLPPI